MPPFYLKINSFLCYYLKKKKRFYQEFIIPAPTSYPSQKKKKKKRENVKILTFSKGFLSFVHYGGPSHDSSGQ
jgi:hypothetical protein